jgi:hypothetical protein
LPSGIPASWKTLRVVGAGPDEQEFVVRH